MTPPVSIARAGASTIMAIGMFYVIFSMGAVIGADAVGNESVDIGEQRSNISDIGPNVTEEARHNITTVAPNGPSKAIASSAVTQVSWIASGAVWGYDFGVAYPTAADLNARMAPWVLFSTAWTLLSRRLGNNRGIQKW